MKGVSCNILGLWGEGTSSTQVRDSEVRDSEAASTSKQALYKLFTPCSQQNNISWATYTAHTCHPTP